MNSLNLIGICFFFNLKKHTYIIQVYIKKKKTCRLVAQAQQILKLESILKKGKNMLFY